MRNETLAWLRTELELQREYIVELIMVDTSVSETADLRTENDRLRTENDRLRRDDTLLDGLDPIVSLYLSRTGFAGLDQK
jgi:hypothetical protein